MERTSQTVAVTVPVLIFAVIQAVSAQSRKTENIYSLDAEAGPAPASIEDVAWLAGHWVGEGLGGRIEETWNAPSGGTMLGSFKLIQNGKPFIYELELLTEVAGSLAWQVKHFDASFHAWEEKEEFVAFPLVKIEPGAAYFDGLTVLRDGDDRVNMYLAVHGEEGVREEPIRLRRVR